MNFSTLMENLMKEAAAMPVVEKIEDIAGLVSTNKDFADKMKQGLTNMSNILNDMIKLIP